MSTRETSDALHPVLLRFVEKLQDSLGDVATRCRSGMRAAPIETWTGRDVIDFIRDVRNATGDDYMGIASSPCPLGANDFIIDLGARSATLREAVTMGIRFMSMVTSAAHFRLDEGSENATIVISHEPSDRDPEQALTVWSMIVWHKLCQWLIGEEISLDRSEFSLALDTTYSSYAEMFGGECIFNAHSSRLVFKRSYLDHRVIRTRLEADWLKTAAPGAFAKPTGLAKPWRQQVNDLFRIERWRGAPLSTIETVAEHFGVSSQTLRRRLRDEGTSYRELKAKSRLEGAVDVLAGNGGTIGEASIAAGFAETNALTRALKTSNGITSSQLREQVKVWRSEL